MQKTQNTVRDLTDAQVVDVVKRLFNDVYSQISYRDIRENSTNAAEVSSLMALSKDALEQDLAPDVSVRLGRLVLDQCARDPALSPLVLK